MPINPFGGADHPQPELGGIFNWIKMGRRGCARRTARPKLELTVHLT